MNIWKTNLLQQHSVCIALQYIIPFQLKKNHCTGKKIPNLVCNCHDKQYTTYQINYLKYDPKKVLRTDYLGELFE